MASAQLLRPTRNNLDGFRTPPTEIAQAANRRIPIPAQRPGTGTGAGRPPLRPLELPSQSIGAGKARDASSFGSTNFFFKSLSH